MCFGKRTQISWHSHFGIFNNVGASSTLTWVLADTAYAACPSHPGSLEIMSMTFAAVICDADDPCSVNTAFAPESSYTMSTRNTTLPLYFRYRGSKPRILKVTKINRRRVSDFRQLPCWNFLCGFPFFDHCCLCTWNFHCLKHRNEFVNKTVMMHRLHPFSNDTILVMFVCCSL